MLCIGMLLGVGLRFVMLLKLVGMWFEFVVFVFSVKGIRLCVMIEVELELDLFEM